MQNNKIIIAYQSSIRSLRNNSFSRQIQWWYDESITVALKSMNTSIGASWVTGPGIVEACLRDANFYKYQIYEDQIGRDILASHYDDFCRSAIRPTLYSSISRQKFTDISWINYQLTNRAYANTICRIAPKRSTILIIDYPLMLVPYYIKKQRSDLFLAYYHHAPLPAPSVCKTLKHLPKIISHLDQADQLVFGSAEKIENFKAIMRLHSKNIGTKLMSPDLILAPYAQTLLPARDTKRALKIEWDSNLERLKKNSKVFITSFEHLEEKSGIGKLLESIELMLKINPSLKHYCKFIILCSPSDHGEASYSDTLKKRVYRLIGKINGLYSQLEDPIIFFQLKALDQQIRRVIFKHTEIMIANSLVDEHLPYLDEFLQETHSSSPTVLLSKFIENSSINMPNKRFNPYDTEGLAYKLAELIKKNYYASTLKGVGTHHKNQHYSTAQWLEIVMQKWPGTISSASPSQHQPISKDKSEYYRPVI